VGEQPEAPAPHPTLEELVREYHRYGLPLPPFDAELVRINWWRNNPDRPFILRFRSPSRESGGWPTLHVGVFWGPEGVEPDRTTSAKPAPQALERVGMGAGELLCLTALCKMRGWDELAEAAYAEAREELAGRARHYADDPAAQHWLATQPAAVREVSVARELR